VAIERTVVPGTSMEPTLAENTSIIVNRLSYLTKGPKRFDVIVFEQEGEEHSYYHVKRVIGLPGERVQIANGLVYIDGEPLKEAVHGLAQIHLSGLATEELILDEDEYFVLGDNRNHSADSRETNVGLIHRDELIGRAWIRIWPLNGIGVISHE
jgi:signal peptidase I